jgi:uncharacterized protein YyaL (SSP411 family)
VHNALIRETSPYLRQHAANPVSWLPWGPEALAAARTRDVPLLVSIGYSACHWCHVMERECFEDPRTAALMNEELVCVKVDREERPDIDALYMEAVQAMTGHGGWPLNVFLTPEQVPFYGGTYFPPEPRGGMPSWTQVLQAIAATWRENAAEIRAGGERIAAQLGGGARLRPSGERVDERALDGAVGRLRESFDAVHGGWGGAPKFPQAPVLEFLLAHGEREMSLATLRAMAAGGIHDQVGGGFHRYAVDATWTVPHFEKMLYDNALLASAYLHGWQTMRAGRNGDARQRRVSPGFGREEHEPQSPSGPPRAHDADEERLLEVCTGTLDWALCEMRGPEGGFYSALDADSEGVEGRFYVWSVAQLREALGEDADAAIAWLGATEQGNFADPHAPPARDGARGWRLNVLRGDGPAPPAAVRARIRERLLAARAARLRPGLDDKRLTSWNALMIGALADAGAALAGERPDDARRYLDAAVACAEFLLGTMRDERGRLLRTYNDGQAKIGAFLEDHAFLLEALLVLFEASCEERWFQHATAVADELIARFADPEHGGFFATAAGGEQLIARSKDLEDSPIPAGSSSAAMGLLRLAQLTGDSTYERHALGAIALVAEIAPRHPTAFGHMLQAMHWRLAPARPIACAVPPRAGSAA